MYCPSCKAEFVEGIEVCNACDTALLPNVPPVPDPPDLDLVTVGNYPNPASAELAAEYLKSAGIEVLVTNEHTLGLNWLYTAALGGVDLAVSEEQAEEAKDLLASMTELPSTADEPAEFEGGHIDPGTLRRAETINCIKALLTLLVTAPVVFLPALALSFGRRGKEPPATDREGDA